jgi:hypothetical protein
MWNAGDVPARMIEIISPAAFETSSTNFPSWSRCGHPASATETVPIVLHAFEGKAQFPGPILTKIDQLKAVYGLTLTAADAHKLKDPS